MASVPSPSRRRAAAAARPDNPCGPRASCAGPALRNKTRSRSLAARGCRPSQYTVTIRAVECRCERSLPRRGVRWREHRTVCSIQACGKRRRHVSAKLDASRVNGQERGHAGGSTRPPCGLPVGIVGAVERSARRTALDVVDARLGGGVRGISLRRNGLPRVRRPGDRIFGNAPHVAVRDKRLE